MNCVNCGAPLVPGQKECEYCGTGYSYEVKYTRNPYVNELQKQIYFGILTPNEVRGILKLDPIEEPDVIQVWTNKNPYLKRKE